ncbi:hypothetical protein [Gluconobacter japonicus]|uniref:Uncharacterized protein n=1 Tax=Gluconobacter japonicus TaxID=376620 RepID=A0ABQ5WJC6_GLUJA|nr:hypothetical protein [Gluconobacter japonicus]KXV28501.1 hypothetical protein AD938_04305 [Gluconobacter japonicus]GBR25568.1 hypothetical protein AA3271_2068 [Gluconobacter japonicus NBRC 3271]GLQ59962.1 hypothetical protein GCM10010937_17650 [Gluconobacter japonicus]
MSEKSKPTPTPVPTDHARRAVWRIGRGRSGGSLALGIFTFWALAAGRRVLVADGDPNNPTLSKLFPADGGNGVQRPANAELEASKVWLANTLAQALTADASIVIDMGGGDRVSEELAAESDLGAFLKANGVLPTFAYFTGPERDDFDHVFRIWDSSSFKDGDQILLLNEGLYRSPSRSTNPFAWLRKDPRLTKMEEAGVRIVVFPALTCMKYLEHDNMNVFDVVAGKPKADGTQVNPLWRHMTIKWLKDFQVNLEEEGVMGWLP